MTREEFEALKAKGQRKVAGPCEYVWGTAGGFDLRRLGIDGEAVACVSYDGDAYVCGVRTSRWPKGMKRHAQAWADAWLIAGGYEVVDPVTFADAVSAKEEP